MKCPSCNSDNTQKLSVAHSSGLSEIETASTGAGVGVNLSGGVGIGLGRNKTKGIQQTDLSIHTSPPTRFSYGAILFRYFKIWLLTMLVLIILENTALPGSASPIPGNLLTLLIFGYAIYKCYRGYVFNKTEFPEAMSIWENGYICLRCGRTYTV